MRRLYHRSFHPPRPILDRLRNVRGLNALRPGQISDGARQLEHAVIGTGRQPELFGSFQQQCPAFAIGIDNLLDQARACGRICEHAFGAEFEIAAALYVTGGGDAGRNLDQVAYVRFASVYREFKDVREFVKEVKPMLRKFGSTRAGTE